METIIPKHIARRTYYSIPFIFLTSIVAYRYHYRYLSFLLCFLTYTSLVFWNNPKKGYSLEKIIDMSTAAMTILTAIMFDSYHFTDNHRYFFWGIMAVCIVGFMVNDFWFHFQMQLLDDLSTNQKTEYILKIEKTREKVQSMEVYIHMFFLHLLPSLASIYCIVNSPSRPLGLPNK